MKILFLGCSWTDGYELGLVEDREKYRFSTIIGRKLNAEVVNLSEPGRSNHAIARIFLEQDLSQYDRVFIQMSNINRFEWYDPTGKSQNVKLREKIERSSGKERERQLKILSKPIPTQNLWDKILVTKKQYLTTGNVFEGKEWWQRFYEEIYDDKLVESQEYMYFHLFKNRLTALNIPHLIFSINSKCKLPIDLQLNQMKYPRAPQGHPNKIGHIMLANDILKLL